MLVPSNFNSFLLNFNKIFINFKNKNSNFFFLTNNFFLFNNFNFFYLLNSKDNQIFLNFNFIKINFKKNYFFFLKKLNKYKYFLINFKFLLKYKFKYNKFFNYIYILKKKYFKINYSLDSDFNNKFFLYKNFFNSYFSYFFKNWQFLTGFAMSPFLWTLHSRKKLINKEVKYKFSINRYFFNKNKIKTKPRNFNFIKHKNFTKKYLINNYYYIKNFNKKNIFTTFKYILKIKSSILKKKTNDWFLSKPYLFLNTYKNFKLRKYYLNFFLIVLYKKYFKFFRILKRLTFNLKYKKNKKMNKFFFFKTVYNSDLKSKSYKNKNFQNYINFKTKFFLFYFKSKFFKIKKKLKTLMKKKINLFFLLKILYKGKILKKNKLFSIYRIFVNKKFNIYKFSKKSKKKIIFIRSFNFFNKINNKIFSLNLKKNKIKFTDKYLFNSSESFLKKKFNLKFKLKYNKFLLKFYFLKYNFKSNLNKSLNFFNFFKWKNYLSYKYIKLKKNKFIFKKNSNLIKNFKDSNIFERTKNPIFLTKSKLNFSFKFYGFLFLNNNIFNYLNNYEFIYNIKKNLYSFSYKNDIQKFILKKYIKNNFLSDFISKNTLFNNYNDYYNYIEKNSFNYYKHLLIQDFNQNFNFIDFLNFKNNQLQILINKNTSNFDTWNYYNNQYKFFRKNFKNDSDFNIKRIRFKPGYMTLWREVRSVLKNSLSLNFKYQYKLTSYLSKYNKFIKFKTFLSLEMELINILLRSRLFNNKNLILLFIKNNLIYVNGILSNNPNLQIFVGDFIQVIINLKYYIMSRWFLNLNLKKKIKIKNVFKKKNSNYNQLEEKKRSYHMPKWISSNRNLFDDSANYLEVDYFTLSVFILYEPFLWSDINPYNLIEQKFSIINLYNWKYIN